MDKVFVEVKDLKEAIGEWWDSWHTYAGEDDGPEYHIQPLIDAVTKATGEKFNSQTGIWQKP